MLDRSLLQRIARIFFLLLIATAASASAATQASTSGAVQPVPAGQSSQPSASGSSVANGSDGQYTIHTSVSEVVIYATVLDKHEQLVTSLKQPDFTVYEDGVQQKIASFSQRDVPVSLGILVDNSGSMGMKRAAVDRAAIDLVRASNPDDESFIVNFSDEAFLDQDFTSNIGLLEKGLSHIDSTGGTALYDAVIAAADHLAKHGKHAKQALLVVTDGEDNSSSSTLADAVRRIQSLNGPIVYSIGLLYDESGGDTRKAKKALQTLSEETGGIAFFPKSLNQVHDIAEEVAQDIRQQYMIGYHPTRPISDGGYRTIHVVAHAKGFGKLTVRTRKGYFARPSKN